MWKPGTPYGCNPPARAYAVAPVSGGLLPARTVGAKPTPGNPGKVRARMPKPRPKTARRQYGAVPFRIGADGEISVLLVTTRGTGRWIVPKGWPIAHLRPRDVAAREAYEEAGLIGDIVGKKPIGRFTYEKPRAGGQGLLCEVKLFAMHISHQLPDWPERQQRETGWFALEAAAALVGEGALASLLLRLPDSLRPKATAKAALANSGALTAY